MALLSVRGVTKRYGGVTALAAVDLEVEAGHVLGLLGANGSGKSTLSSVISGETRPDEGSVLVEGRPLLQGTSGTPRAAREAGIVIAHQHPGLAPDLPVWENVFLGAERCVRGGFIDRRTARREAANALGTLRTGWDIDMPAGALGAADQQMIDIAKALVLRPRLLILDEPTAALAAAEVEALIGVVKALAMQGTAIVFISHRMAEIEALCDSVVVLCNGKRVGQLDVGRSLDEARVLQMMGGIAGGAADTDAIPPEAAVHLATANAGHPAMPAAADASAATRAASPTGPDPATTESMEYVPNEAAPSTPAAPVMTVRGLKAGRRLAGADLVLKRGEILGVAGLQGHGQDELLDTLAGVLPLEAGEVVLDGKTIVPRSPRQMIGSGVCLVPNDRHRQGLWLEHSVEFNLAQVRVNFDRRAWQLPRTQLRTMVADIIDRLKIKTASPRQTVGALSGGNQQKVVIGRWLDRDVKVLLLSDPTKGVDVIARKQIYQAIHALAQGGVAILLYASDTDELLAVCDRLVVMYEGRVVSELEGPSMNEAQVTRASFGRSAA